MKQEFVFLDRPVRNPVGKGIMYVVGVMLFTGLLLFTPLLVPMHFAMRAKGLKGIYLHDGYLININDTAFERRH